jgi:hypothetical protein
MESEDNKEIKVTASDALEFEPVTRDSSSGGWTLRILLSLVLFTVGAVSWGLYGDTMIKQFSASDGEVPIIEASVDPIKVRPENPGGLEVPNRDKLVYNRMQKDLGKGVYKEKELERLLPPPEQLLEKSKFLAKNKSPIEPTENIAKSVKLEKLFIKKEELPKKIKSYPVARVPTIKDVKTAKRPSPPPPPPQAPGLKTIDLSKKSSISKETQISPEGLKGKKKLKKITKVDTQISKSTKNLKILSEPKSTPVVVSNRATSNFYHVQLAATRTSKQTSEEWKRLKGRHMDLLGRLSLTINKVDLGAGRGIFYRLRAGPLVDEGKARELCKSLANRQVGCLMIKPKK